MNIEVAVLAALVVGGQAAVGVPSIVPSLEVADSECTAAAQERFGRSASMPAKNFVAPRRVRYVEPKYPRRSRDGAARAGPGGWELLIAPTGGVDRVWLVRKTKRQTESDLEVAIYDAVRQWRYDPATIRDVPVPLCLAVSVAIHWR